jgi:hypothetical protein
MSTNVEQMADADLWFGHRALPSTEECMPLVSAQQTSGGYRWFVLASFCLFSFTNALQWIAFSPALQTFAQYFFGEDTLESRNAIYAFSGTYLVIYPLLVPFSFSYFEDEEGSKLGSGLRRGITIGAVLNAAAGVLRWLGSYPSWKGYLVVFTGQVLAAIGKLFRDNEMLCYGRYTV